MTDVSFQAGGQRPFIIWTLRRTGGTNLAQYLSELSRFPGSEHEPFNTGRAFGHITDAFRDTGDMAPLTRDVQVVCARGHVIKHCVETVPEPVTQALLDASLAVGYRHVFLVRSSPVDRVLSLFFAQMSGVWGKGQIRDRDPAEIEAAVRAADIPVADLRNRELADRAALRRIYDRLEQAGQTPLIATFEDLYNYQDRDLSLAILSRLKQALGLGDGGEDARDRDRGVLFGGAQKTRDIYRLFANYAAFERGQNALGPFQFRAPPALPDAGIAAFTAQPGCRIFGARQSWRTDLVRIDGTALPPGGWRLRAGGADLEMQDGLVSPNLARAFPGHDGVDTARFAALDVPLKVLDQLEMVARTG